MTMFKKLECFSFLLAMSVVASTVEVAVSFSPTTTTTIAKSYVNYSSSSPRSRIPLDSAVDEPSANIADDEDDSLDMDAFKARKAKQEDELRQQQEVESDFDGYALRDAIYEKWGLCYDLDFNPVDSFGFRGLYLNVLPFHLGGRRFRHDTELDYLCHLQAIVEILQKYDQLGYILSQIGETDKKPRAGTSPLVAVPLRLDLSREQVTEIIGY